MLRTRHTARIVLVGALLGGLTALAAPAQAATGATNVCGGSYTIAEHRVCILSAAVGATQSVAGLKPVLKGTITPWQKDTTNFFITSDPHFAETIAGTQAGQSTKADAYSTYDYKNHSGSADNNASRIVSVTAKSAACPNTCYHYRQWDAQVNWNYTQKTFTTSSRYSDYPACKQTYASFRSPNSDCHTGTVVRVTSDSAGPPSTLTVTSTGIRVTESIERFTYKITNDKAGANSASTKGTYTLQDTFSGNNHRVTTTWKLGATSVTTHITGNVTTPTRMDVSATR